MTARKLTDREKKLLMAPAAKPQSWQAAWQKNERVYQAPKGRELSFTDIIVLRRVKAGQTGAEICAAMKIGRSTLNMRVASIVKRFGVTTREELLALPEIQEKLKES